MIDSLDKESLMLRCHYCYLLDYKSIDIKTKEIYIKCCNNKYSHKLTSFENTPKECPYFSERFMLSIN